MKKLIIYVIFFILSIGSLFSQVFEDTIYAEKVCGGYKFYQYGNRVNLNELAGIMEENFEASVLLKAARLDYTLSNMFLLFGTVLIGWETVSYISNGHARWILSGIGAGIILIAIPVSRLGSRQALEAVETFNEGLPNRSGNQKPDMNIALTGRGIGLTIKF